jgi:hypothetical protein
MIGASDGGLKNDIGSFGWKWHLPKAPDSNFERSGPADALPSEHSSTRAELLGVSSALTFISMYCQFFDVTIHPNFHPFLHCDNDIAIKKSGEAQEDDMFTSFRCYGIYDVVKEIRILIAALPFSVTSHWVKGRF